MNISIFNTDKFYDLKRVYINFMHSHCDYSELISKKNMFINNKIFIKPKYANSLIDRLYKMKYIYMNDHIKNEYMKTYENIPNSYNSSYSSYGSYSSYTSYNSYTSFSSYSSYSSFYGSYGSYNSYSGSFTPLYGSFNNIFSSYTSCKISNYPFINLSNVQMKREVYKNEYEYKSCGIKQNFFITGYGLELI